MSGRNAATILDVVVRLARANAHSRYYSEDVYKAASSPKELVIVPDADHVDLYDDLKKIPFDRLEAFFKNSLAPREHAKS